MGKLPAPTHRSSRADGTPLSVCDLCGCLVEAHRLRQSDVQGLRGYWICDTHDFEREARLRMSWKDRGGASQMIGAGGGSGDDLPPNRVGSGDTWWENPTTTVVLPTVTVSATSSFANEDGSSDGNFRFSRGDGPANTSLSVYFTISGTATPTTDYTALSSPAVIPAGSDFVDVPVVAVDDADVEGIETVIVTIDANANYTVGSQSSATVSVVSDDVVTSTPVLTYSSYYIYPWVPDGSTHTIRFVIAADVAPASDLTVNYMYSEGPAYGGLPPVYLTNGSFTFSAGNTSVAFDELISHYVGIWASLGLNLQAGTGYTLGDPSSVSGILYYNDFPPPPEE